MQSMSSYPDFGEKIEHVVPAQLFIAHELCEPTSPFVQLNKIQKIFKRVLLWAVQVTQKCVGTELFVVNIYRELFSIQKPVRVLISVLLDKGILHTWELSKLVFADSIYYKAVLRGGEIRAYDTSLISEKDFFDGSSVQDNASFALTVALAELLERYSSMYFDTRTFTYSTIRGHKQNAQNFFDKRYQKKLRVEVDEIPLPWVEMYELTTKQKVWVPASSVFYMYEPALDEPIFMESSSNGVAAHSHKNKAIVSSIYEQIERDGFLLYWLNKMSPTRIALETVPDNQVQEIYADYIERGFQMHLLDCKTEFKIPVVVLCLVDTKTGAINVNACADIDITKAIRKVFLDCIKWDPYSVYTWSGGDIQNITSLHERANLWFSGVISHEADFLFAGPVCTYSQFCNYFDFQGSPQSIEEEYSVVTSLVYAIAQAIFVFDFSNPLQIKTGLHVVRTIIPEVLPIYFKENNQHDNVDRLYTFAQKMGYAERVYTNNDINTVPHPFV